MTVNLSRRPSSEKLVTVTFNSSTLISQRVGGGGGGGSNEPPLKINNGGRKSTMRKLNNYMRCTMRESRMSALVLMHIKYDRPVNLEEIVNLFEGLHPRMMQFTSLVYDYQH